MCRMFARCGNRFVCFQFNAFAARAMRSFRQCARAMHTSYGSSYNVSQQYKLYTQKSTDCTVCKHKALDWACCLCADAYATNKYLMWVRDCPFQCCTVKYRCHLYCAWDLNNCPIDESNTCNTNRDTCTRLDSCVQLSSSYCENV